MGFTYLAILSKTSTQSLSVGSRVSNRVNCHAGKRGLRVMSLSVFTKQLSAHLVWAEPGDKIKGASRSEVSGCWCVCVGGYFPAPHPGHILCHKWLWKTDHIDISLQFKYWKKGPKSRTGAPASRQPLNIICSHGLILHYSWTNTVRMFPTCFK